MNPSTVLARIESLEDVYSASQDRIAPEQVRRIEVDQARFDDKAYALSLPRPLIDHLGLRQGGSKFVRTATGSKRVPGFDPVRLTIGDRDCTIEVIERLEDSQVVFGPIVLALVDLVVDPVGQRLIGNPAHGGRWMIEMY